MIKGTTASGFEFEVDEDLLQDCEFLELFAHVMKGGTDSMEIFDLAENALGTKQKKQLYDHVRGENGRVPLDGFTAEMTEIFDALGSNGKTKN